jgi:hypothetical protein
MSAFHTLPDAMFACAAALVLASNGVYAAGTVGNEGFVVPSLSCFGGGGCTS